MSSAIGWLLHAVCAGAIAHACLRSDRRDLPGIRIDEFHLTEGGANLTWSAR